MDRKSGIAYFYCSFSDLASQAPLNIFCSLLVQFSETIASLSQKLLSKYLPMAQKQLGRSMDLEELVDIFRRHTGGLNRAFIVIDAINESERAEEIQKVLLNLAETCKNIRLIVTSTSRINGSWCESRHVKVAQCYMSTKTIDADIRVYVDDQIANNVSLSTLSPSLKKEVKEAILSRANGVLVRRSSDPVFR